ncbi:DUF6318 family protein [Isoptericola haloaureus]|uniref:DUF6318 family protein n=1 Tax=Isoptericola haloaureus TaxID=1542902 RepID=A0ABU7Z6E5_9MICO
MARTPRHHLQLLPLAAAVLGAALLTGCTGDQPAPEAVASSPPASTPASDPPSAEPSPSPSPSETGPSKPERPAAMDKKDADGAAAAVKYILALEQPMMVTGDTAEWERRSHRSCEYCASRLDQAQTIAERGDIFEGGDVSVTVDTVYQRDAVTGIWPVDITGDESPSEILDRAGEVVFTSDGGTGERRVEVALKDGSWVLVELGMIPDGD